MHTLCFTSYIYGDKYQEYIPLTIYSIAKSYPEYHIRLFINNKLRPDIKECLDLIRPYYDKFKIIENKFNDCPQMTPLKAKSLRWVLWDDEFMNFDYLYYIDSDMLYIRELSPLHVLHVKHMNYIQSDCISNIIRKKKLSNNNLYTLYNAYKNGGISSFIKYLITPSIYRMTGLHFIKCNIYFKYITPKLRKKYQNIIYTGKTSKATIGGTDEALLFEMIRESGYNMSIFALQKNSISMFESNNPNKKEYCPHHGIHLGLFRYELSNLEPWAIAQLNSPDYLYYIDYYKKNILHDPLFLNLRDKFSNNLKEYITKMHLYYNITD